MWPRMQLREMLMSHKRKARNDLNEARHRGTKQEHRSVIRERTSAREAASCLSLLICPSWAATTEPLPEELWW